MQDGSPVCHITQKAGEIGMVFLPEAWHAIIRTQEVVRDAVTGDKANLVGPGLELKSQGITKPVRMHYQPI
jgi:hypothetical protein